MLRDQPRASTCTRPRPPSIDRRARAGKALASFFKALFTIANEPDIREHVVARNEERSQLSLVETRERIAIRIGKDDAAVCTTFCIDGHPRG